MQKIVAKKRYNMQRLREVSIPKNHSNQRKNTTRIVRKTFKVMKLLHVETSEILMREKKVKNLLKRIMTWSLSKVINIQCKYHLVQYKQLNIKVKKEE